MAGIQIVVLVCFICFGFALSEKVPALFAFGDSLVDSGNNNVLQTNAKGNHPPYGIDFKGGEATGRFSNGLLVVDFLAAYLNLPYPPAYHEAGSNILQGANFGSASAGVLAQTHTQGAEAFGSQVNDFQALVRSLNQRLGSANATTLISNSIFYICIGNNDNAFQQSKSVSQTTISNVLSTFVAQIQALYNLGARKFVIQGLSATGCIPINIQRGRCNSVAQRAASSYNDQLKSSLSSLRSSLQGSHIVETDFYNLMVRVNNQPQSYGFSDSTHACCPMGQSTFGCNQQSRVCPDRTKYAFWDAVHQTQAFNSLAASTWWNGSTSDVYPMSISELAQV